MSTFALNCQLFDDPKRQVFTVEVPITKNVSILRDLIKKEKAPHLDYLDSPSLRLWKVRYPPNQYSTFDHESDTVFLVGEINTSVPVYRS